MRLIAISLIKYREKTSFYQFLLRMTNLGRVLHSEDHLLSVSFILFSFSTTAPFYPPPPPLRPILPVQERPTEHLISPKDFSALIALVREESLQFRRPWRWRGGVRRCRCWPFTYLLSSRLSPFSSDRTPGLRFNGVFRCFVDRIVALSSMCLEREFGGG